LIGTLTMLPTSTGTLLATIALLMASENCHRGPTAGRTAAATATAAAAVVVAIFFRDINYQCM